MSPNPSHECLEAQRIRRASWEIQVLDSSSSRAPCLVQAGFSSPGSCMVCCWSWELHFRSRSPCTTPPSISSYVCPTSFRHPGTISWDATSSHYSPYVTAPFSCCYHSPTNARSSSPRPILVQILYKGSPRLSMRNIYQLRPSIFAFSLPCTPVRSTY
jgi:hypothetical protein